MTRVEQKYSAHTKSINRFGRATSSEIHYLVFEAADEDAALSAVLAVVPQNTNNLYLESVEIDSREGNTTFGVNAIYRAPDPVGSAEEEEDPTESFDCGGGTKHVLYSLGQSIEFGTKDPGGAIGWNGKLGDDCEITGVDVPTAQLRETYTKTMSLTSLTVAYKRSVASLVGKVNSKKFKGWEAGEIMFLGMSYTTPSSGSTHVVVSFNFSVQPNETNAKIGTHTVSKKGFEYVWAISKTESDAGVPKVTIDGIYVDQVCESADFTTLGL